MTRRILIRIGILSAIVLLFLVFALRDDSGPVIEDGSTVVLELSGGYVEGPSAPLIARLMGDTRTPFVSLLSRLALLERDDRVATVVLHVKALDLGWGKAEEIRAGIARLRDHIARIGLRYVGM